MIRTMSEMLKGDDTVVRPWNASDMDDAIYSDDDDDDSLDEDSDFLGEEAIIIFVVVEVAVIFGGSVVQGGLLPKCRMVAIPSTERDNYHGPKVTIVVQNVAN